jgi:hypothetical protein
MPATRRKAAAATINVPAAPRKSWPTPQLDDRSRERRAGLDVSDRSAKMSRADIAIKEGRSQPRRVKDICKLRNSDATSLLSIPTHPLEAGRSRTSNIASTITAVVVGIVDIAPYMCRIMTAAVVIGIITVDRAWTYRQVNSWAAATTFDHDHISPGAFAGLQNGLPARFRIGHWRNADEANRQHTRHQNRCE